MNSLAITLNDIKSENSSSDYYNSNSIYRSPASIAVS